ncbi:E3 ubiquitin-protein ligase ZSWIM2-like isoform X2, partial [Biomphalaria pfeifferi]
MARSVAWRRTVSDACCWHQTQALESTLYILRQTGPTGFLLKEEGETKNVK